MPTAPYRNRLIHETSPYLLQHAHNPVDWYPWGPEALDRAHQENKPILLSIGYSACHWCHVMAHESFEDPATAELMNERFVNIKVDREERPDLDKIYQTAYQLLYGRGGGWPLTLFLTPDDQVPFLGGTYFPREPRYGMPGFKELLRGLSSYYREHEADVRRQNGDLLRTLHAGPPHPTATGDLNPMPLQAARDQLLELFDPVHGGFGQAPKFPHPTNLERLLRHWARSVQDRQPDQAAGNAVLTTLRKMAQGGLYDQLGGGFCRYAVDGAWQIPHFEKMLYDNGPLLAIYSQAWQASGEPLFRTIAEETGDWVLRDMQSPAGGYYATLDADSEGVEGKFYLWTPPEVQALLSTEEYAVCTLRFGLDQPPNFEDSYWHLRVCLEIETIARRTGSDPTAVTALLASARTKLLAARNGRIWPGRDEKLLTAWNGLMIKGMAVAGRVLGRTDFIASAERALDCVRAHLWRDGRLLAVYKDGKANLPAYLDDYACLADAILELLQVRWRDADVAWLLELVEGLLNHFQDPDGGFYFTADDHEPLIQRPKPLYDDALPAGNGVAAQVLLRLDQLLDKPAYRLAGERTLQAAWPSLTRLPSACGALLQALEDYRQPLQTLILRGPTEALLPWQARCAQVYAPHRLTLTIPATATVLPGLLAERRASEGGVIAYVCHGTTCSAPLTTLTALTAALNERAPCLTVQA